jgi:hypothetical protein
MPDPIKLPTEMVAKLQQAQRQLTDILPEFDKLEQCGGDCAEFRRLHQEYLSRATALLQNYGPGLPVQ